MVVQSLNGAWRLFRGRADGLQLLDRSLGGFWRSFLAVGLILPIHALSVLSTQRGVEGEAVEASFLDSVVVLLVDWVAFPLLLAAAARPLGVTGSYVTYVVARNWAAPIAGVIVALPLLVELLFGADPSLAAFLSIIALAVVLRYHFVVLRLALGTSVATSIALVVIDFLLSLLILALFGAGAQ